MVKARLAAVVTVAAFLAGCGAPTEEVTSASSTTTAAAGEGWSQLPASPLSPRGGAVLTTLEDGRVLVVGGDTSPGCHDMPTIRQDAPRDTTASGRSSGPAVIATSTADCDGPEKDTRLADGALLDESGGWTQIAAAPAPLSHPTRGIQVGGVVYFWARPAFIRGEAKPGAWMSYDVGANSWARLEDPPAGEHPAIGVVRAGDRLVAYQTSDENGEKPDLLYDPANNVWSELPDDPLPESFDRMMVWTGSGVGLVGRELEALNQPNGPPLHGAVFDLGEATWHTLGDGEVSHSNVTWEWALPRLVNAPVAGADPELGSALPPAPSIPASCDDVHPPADRPDGESAIGDLHLGDWTLNVPPETNGTTSCNERMAEHALSTAWAFDGVVAFGGYDVVAEPGQLPTGYEFNDDAWIWRQAG